MSELVSSSSAPRAAWGSALGRGLAAALLVGLAGAAGAWPAWLLAAGLVPWRAGLSRTARLRDALLAAAAVAVGAAWGVGLGLPAAAWDRPAFVAAVLLAGWAGARAARQADALAHAGLSAAGLAPLTALGWALAQGDLATARGAALAALAAWLWAWAAAGFVTYARQRRPAAWGVSGLFFVATLSLAGLVWAAPAPEPRGPDAAPRADAAPTPHPALAATLTAVAEAAARPPSSPPPSPTATAPAEPSPSPTPAPPTATPTPAATPTPTLSPTPSPYPTFPPPPVYTGYGVVQVPPEWGQGAFVRNAPQDDAKVVAVVPNGTLLKVLGYRTAGIQVWLKVRSLEADWEGWIISTALQVATPAP